ncbi:MAG: porin family protein [Candidatus Eisenbacteria bacterium]|uniref:Porin family protein n=1 Tax=Eiseniibacteriota bacterium TaxID=2212470 RepID=A0A956NHZ7_UNCEI|nr:porin family protein [Candidatus Eisenbacteria bacterium]MCB9465514.1 porin family protein [Candidatus Eisenbacteria bacterium]
MNTEKTHSSRKGQQQGIAKRWFLAAGTGLAMASLPVAAHAAGATGGGDYGIHVGYMKAAEAEDGDVLIGGHIEARLAPALGIQAAVDYNGSETYPLASVDSPAVEVRTIPVTLSARLYLPVVSGFSPFLAAGGGWYNVVYDFPQQFEALGFDDETVSTFGWHLGLGGKWRMADRVSIYGEGRYTFLDPDKKLGDDVQQEIGELDYDRSNIIAGLSLEF